MLNPRKPQTFMPSKYTLYTVFHPISVLAHCSLSYFKCSLCLYTHNHFCLLITPCVDNVSPFLQVLDHSNIYENHVTEKGFTVPRL